MMTTKDDLTKFLQRSRETTDLIAREEYETALMLALELNEQLEAENQRLREVLMEAEQMLEMTAFGSSALDTVKDALKEGE